MSPKTSSVGTRYGNRPMCKRSQMQAIVDQCFTGDSPQCGKLKMADRVHYTMLRDQAPFIDGSRPWKTHEIVCGHSGRHTKVLAEATCYDCVVAALRAAGEL